MNPRAKLMEMGISREDAGKICFCTNCMQLRDALEVIAANAYRRSMTTTEIANAFALVSGTMVGQMVIPGDLGWTLKEAGDLQEVFAKQAEARCAELNAKGILRS